MMKELERHPLPLGSMIVRRHFALLFGFTNPTRVLDDVDEYLRPLLGEMNEIAEQVNIRLTGDVREQSKDPIPDFMIQKIKIFLAKYEQALN